MHQIIRTLKVSLPASVTMTQIETRIADIFHMARICRQTSAELDAALRAQILDPLNTRTPGGRHKHSAWVSGYAAGYIAARRADLYRYHLEFCYKAPDGALYSTHDESTHKRTAEFYAAGRGGELANMPGGHYWRDSDRPFFTGAPI